jgi:hypothetical protein
MFYLFGKKVIFCFFIFLLASPVWAQKNQYLYKKRNQKSTDLKLVDYDIKPLHFGFQIGFFNAGTKINHSGFLIPSPSQIDTAIVTRYDSLIAVESSNKPGFSIGFVLNIGIVNELWDLRLLPHVSFYERQITYTYLDVVETQSIEQTMIELPVLIKYKSFRRGNFRAYITGGFNLSYQVGGEKTSQLDKISFSKYNFEVTYGIGIHRYMKYFNFAPEIRFSHGIPSILDGTGGVSTKIDRISTHKVALYLNFEG